MKAVGVIPARWGSSRLPGKSLIPIDAWTGEPLGKAVNFGAARFIPTNTGDGNLYVVAGEALVYGLFVR